MDIENHVFRFTWRCCAPGCGMAVFRYLLMEPFPTDSDSLQGWSAPLKPCCWSSSPFELVGLTHQAASRQAEVVTVGRSCLFCGGAEHLCCTESLSLKKQSTDNPCLFSYKWPVASASDVLLGLAMLSPHTVYMRECLLLSSASGSACETPSAPTLLKSSHLLSSLLS